MDTFEVTFLTITPYREHIRAGMSVRAQEAVREQCPEGLSVTGNGPMLTTLPANCEIKMDRTEAIRHAAEVRAMPTLRSDLVVSLYNQPEIWPKFGYEGSSAEHGGYLARGFDDINWLPTA